MVVCVAGLKLHHTLRVVALPFPGGDSEIRRDHRHPLCDRQDRGQRQSAPPDHSSYLENEPTVLTDRMDRNSVQGYPW